MINDVMNERDNMNLVYSIKQFFVFFVSKFPRISYQLLKSKGFNLLLSSIVLLQTYFTHWYFFYWWSLLSQFLVGIFFIGGFCFPSF